MNVTAQLRFYFNAVVNTLTGYNNPGLNISMSLGNGASGADVFDQLYTVQGTITNSGTPASIDLRGAGLVGSDLGAASFPHVCTIIGVNRSAAQTLTFGGGSNAWASAFTQIVLPPSSDITNKPSFFIIHAQAATVFATTAGTGDLVQVATDGGTNIPFTFFVGGRSA